MTRSLPVGGGLQRASRDLPEEGHQARPVDRADLRERQSVRGGALLWGGPRRLGPALGQHGPAVELQASCRGAVREMGAEGVHPPSLRGLVGHAQPRALQEPRVGGRQGQGEARFIEMAQID